MSFDELYVLSQVMSMYPRQWNATLKRSLLMDISVLVNDNIDADVQNRINRITESLVAPLAKILLRETEAMASSKEEAAAKEQQLNATLSTLRNEKESALKQLEDEKEQTLQQNMFIETLLSDMDKMAKVSEQRKKEILHLQHSLFVKDLQVQRLTSDERNSKDTHSTHSHAQTFEENMKECLQWVSAAAATTTTESHSLDADESSAAPLSVSSASSNLAEQQQQQQLETEENVPVLFDEIDKESAGLLQLLLTGVWHEGMLSVQIVQDAGLCSVPSALVRFWLGVVRRIASHMAEMLLLKVQDSALGFVPGFL